MGRRGGAPVTLEDSMPWTDHQGGHAFRLRVMIRAQQLGDVSQACREFGISRRLFSRQVVRRYERARMVLTSNKSFLDWGEVCSDPALATAILDRLMHYLTTLSIKGESYRLKEKRRTGLLGGAGPSLPKE